MKIYLVLVVDLVRWVSRKQINGGAPYLHMELDINDTLTDIYHKAQGLSEEEIAEHIEEVVKDAIEEFEDYGLKFEDLPEVEYSLNKDGADYNPDKDKITVGVPAADGEYVKHPLNEEVDEEKDKGHEDVYRLSLGDVLRYGLGQAASNRLMGDDSDESIDEGIWQAFLYHNNQERMGFEEFVEERKEQYRSRGLKEDVFEDAADITYEHLEGEDVDLKNIIKTVYHDLEDNLEKG